MGQGAHTPPPDNARHFLRCIRRGRRPRRPADTHGIPAKSLSLRGAQRRGNPHSLRAASPHYVSVGRGDHTSPPDNARHFLRCFRRGRRPRRPADNAPHPRKNPVIARSAATWQSALPLRRTPSLSPPHFCPFPAKIFPFFPLTGKIACGIFTVLIRIVHLTHRKEA